MWLRLSQKRAAVDVNLNIASRCFYLAYRAHRIFNFVWFLPSQPQDSEGSPCYSSKYIFQFKQFVFIVHACIVNYRSRVSGVRQVGLGLIIPYGQCLSGHVIRAKKWGFSRLFASNTSPRWTDREGLEKGRTGTRQGSPLRFTAGLQSISRGFVPRFSWTGPMLPHNSEEWTCFVVQTVRPSRGSNDLVEN